MFLGPVFALSHAIRPVAVAAHEPAMKATRISKSGDRDRLHHNRRVRVVARGRHLGGVCVCVCASECTRYMCTVCARSVHCRLHSIWARRKELRVLGCLAVDTSEISMAISKPSVI